MYKMRILLLMLCCALLWAGTALTEDAQPLTWAELNDWAQGCLERARGSQLLNNPTEEEGLTGDGYALVYDFATLYMSQPNLTENSLLMGVLVVDVEETGPRGVAPATPLADTLALFRNDNPMLVGGRGGAVLYAEESADGFSWGYLQRDGQEPGLIQYAVHQRLDEGITDAGLLLTMDQGGVAAVRVYGLQNRITEADLAATRLFVEEQAEQEDYRRVPNSLDGDTVSRFDEADLRFAGLDLLTLSPAAAVTALGAPLRDDTVVDEENGSLRTLTFEDCELVFDGAGRLMLFSCEHGDLEGPRAVRIGDPLTRVLGRFAAETSAGGTLYGTPGQAPYGTVEFGEDASAVLRYATPTSDGRTAVLLMNFEQLELREYFLFWAE